LLKLTSYVKFKFKSEYSQAMRSLFGDLTLRDRKYNNVKHSEHTTLSCTLYG